LNRKVEKNKSVYYDENARFYKTGFFFEYFYVENLEHDAGLI
jgi:hypothetical protein